tara:strand:+ start:119 stop:454 length:336 start_codon:yes stop_codon:yes gene_type:complete
MGWVKDKGGSAVQKFDKGGTVKKQWESKKESLKTKRLAQELADGKITEKETEAIMGGKKNRTEKIGTAKLPEGAVLGKPETFPKYKKIKKPRLPKKGDKPKVVPMSKKKKK